MKCSRCEGTVIKYGKSKTGIQRYRCKTCGTTMQNEYVNYACYSSTDSQIIALLKEGCGTRSISRLLNISTNTVSSRILKISRELSRPTIKIGREYEIDEMHTYIGNKKRRVCIAYALDRKTGEVVDFIVGSRNKGNLSKVVDTLLLASARKIITDGYRTYTSLIPKEIHQVGKRGTNHIERKNLTIRTHVKRLNRRTICGSKKELMLKAVLGIYFWGGLNDSESKRIIRNN